MVQDPELPSGDDGDGDARPQPRSRFPRRPGAQPRPLGLAARVAAAVSQGAPAAPAEPRRSAPPAAAPAAQRPAAAPPKAKAAQTPALAEQIGLEKLSERMYKLHPKKRDRLKVLPALQRLLDRWVGEGVRPDWIVYKFEVIEKIHAHWCDSRSWRDKDGSFAPLLGVWLDPDEGWRSDPQEEYDVDDDPVEMKRSTEAAAAAHEAYLEKLARKADDDHWRWKAAQAKRDQELLDEYAKLGREEEVRQAIAMREEAVKQRIAGFSKLLGISLDPAEYAGGAEKTDARPSFSSAQKQKETA